MVDLHEAETAAILPSTPSDRYESSSRRGSTVSSTRDGVEYDSDNDVNDHGSGRDTMENVSATLSEASSSTDNVNGSMNVKAKKTLRINIDTATRDELIYLLKKQAVQAKRYDTRLADVMASEKTAKDKVGRLEKALENQQDVSSRRIKELNEVQKLNLQAKSQLTEVFNSRMAEKEEELQQVQRKLDSFTQPSENENELMKELKVDRDTIHELHSKIQRLEIDLAICTTRNDDYLERDNKLVFLEKANMDGKTAMAVMAQRLDIAHSDLKSSEQRRAECETILATRDGELTIAHAKATAAEDRATIAEASTMKVEDAMKKLLAMTEINREKFHASLQLLLACESDKDDSDDAAVAAAEISRSIVLETKLTEANGIIADMRRATIIAKTEEVRVTSCLKTSEERIHVLQENVLRLEGELAAAQQSTYAMESQAENIKVEHMAAMQSIINSRDVLMLQLQRADDATKIAQQKETEVKKELAMTISSHSNEKDMLMSQLQQLKDQEYGAVVELRSALEVSKERSALAEKALSLLESSAKADCDARVNSENIAQAAQNEKSELQSALKIAEQELLEQKNLYEESEAMERQFEETIARLQGQIAALRARVAGLESEKDLAIAATDLAVAVARKDFEERLEGLRSKLAVRSSELEIMEASSAKKDTSLSETKALLIAKEDEVMNLKNELRSSKERVEIAESTIKVEQEKCEEQCEALRLHLLEVQKTSKMQTQRIIDLKKALQKELGSKDCSRDSPSIPSASSFPSINGGIMQNGDSFRVASPVPRDAIADSRTDPSSIGPPLANNSPQVESMSNGPSIIECDISDGQHIKVNFEYLRNVVIKYMCSRNIEARQLVTVIATLLHFSNKEMELIKMRQAGLGSWWNTGNP